MAAIGGFRSDLSITRKTDRNFGNVSAGVLFSEVALACSAGGFRRDERVDIPIGCSGRHLELEKQWRIGAR